MACLTKDGEELQKETAHSIDMWRVALRFSKSDVARHLGLTHTGASRKLNGTSPFKATETRLLCQWWGMTFEQLINYDQFKDQLLSLPVALFASPSDPDNPELSGR